MNTINPVPVSAKPINFHNQLIPSFHQNFPILTQQPLNSLSFKTPLPLSIKASSSETPNSKPLKSLIPLSFLKPTLISTITATTLFFTGFYLNPKQAISAPLSPPPTIDTNVEENTERSLEGEIASNSNKIEISERSVEGEIASNSNEIEILRSLLENHIKNRQLRDALTIINKLIELEPNETEWRFLKSHLYVHNGEVELAKLGFRDIILKDPYYIEAYRGLVVASMEDEEMNEIEKKIEEGIKMCSKEGNKESELRDLKLLLAQIWVIEGKYDEALKVYGELVEEEPGDFRPYLCQGMIYTALKKNDEAEKYFEKYRGLVPKENPNAKFEFMMAT